MDRMVNNNIQLTWLLRTYRTYNSTVRFSKYKFYNKLLVSVTLLKVTLGVTWIQPFIYIYIYIYVRTSFDSNPKQEKAQAQKAWTMNL